MSSVCISNCVRDTRAPLRATYVNLYKWPESDAEFVRSMSFSSERSGGGGGGSSNASQRPGFAAPRVVDSISCRQMYLRSYPFSREEEATGRKAMCFGGRRGGRRGGGGGGRERERERERDRRKERRRTRRPCLVLRKVKDMSLGALFRIFHRLLSCSASVDVVDYVSIRFGRKFVLGVSLCSYQCYGSSRAEPTVECGHADSGNSRM